MTILRDKSRTGRIGMNPIFVGTLLLLAWTTPSHVTWGEQKEGAAGTRPAATTQPEAVSLDDGETEPPAWRHHSNAKGEDEQPLKTLGEFYPEQAKRLHALREKNPEEYERVEKQMRPWLRELHEAHTRNPELAQLLVQKHNTEMLIREWERRYNKASPEERKTLMGEGERLAEQRVSLRLQYSHMEIQMLEKRLGNLQARLQERESHKEATVKRELANMTQAASSQPARSASSQPGRATP